MPDTEPASPRRFPWYALVLFLVVGALTVTTITGTRRSRPGAGEVDSQDALTLTAQVRLLYLTRQMSPRGAASPADRQKTGVLRGIRRMAAQTNRAANLRRLAVAQRINGDTGWQATLARLRRSPDAGAPLAVEAELAMWRKALQGKPSQAEARELARRIGRLDLGWYAGPALEAMYRNAGMDAEANKQRTRALRAPVLLVLFEVALFGAGGLGLILLSVGLALVVQHRRRRAPLPAWLRPVPMSPLPRPIATVLYYAFVAYLLAHLGAGALMREALRPWLRGDTMPAGAALVASAAVMALIMVVPVAVMVFWGRRVGLCAAHIGLCTDQVGRDVLWGIGGYLAGLPALGVVLVVSALLAPIISRFVSTPPNPAITEFAAAQAPWMQLVLALQAAVMAPVFEETMFRGALFRSLWGRLSLRGAALLAAGIFAVVHPQLPLGFIAIFVLGCVFNALYRLRGSLVPCIVAHGINNGIIMAMMAVLVSG